MLDPELAAAIRHVKHGHVYQVEPVADLMSGSYDAVTTVGASFEGSCLGLGVTEACDGEIVSVDGATWRIPSDGRPQEAPDDLGLAFAVAAFDGECIAVNLHTSHDWSTLESQIRELTDGDPVVAVRIDGDFQGVLLRSEPRQIPPYRPLAEVLDHEVRFAFPKWSGTLAGFRFAPAEAVIPGMHLHAISSDRKSGGHCHDATLIRGTIRVWRDDVSIGLEHPTR